MSKGSVSKNFDVVGSDPPMDGANFFENAGIQPSPGKAKEDAGMRESNSTKPAVTGGKLPKYPKGSGY
jgi:hypothetical protein